MKMVKIKTEALSGAALDWAVCMAEGLKPEDIYISPAWSKDIPASLFRRGRDEDGELTGNYTTGPALLFSRKWEAAGPIIEREGISIVRGNDLHFPNGNEKGELIEPLWLAKRDGFKAHGQTYLEAAMRCWVLRKLGNEVQVPSELVKSV